MILENKQILFESPLVHIEKVRCERARRGLSCEECKSEHQIGVPLSGVNVHHLGGETFTTTPSSITLSNRGDPYRVSHPYGSGETQLTIVPQENLLVELLAEKDPGAREKTQPFDRHQLPIASKTRLALHLLIAAAQRGSHSTLDLEEAALEALNGLLAGLATNSIPTPTQREAKVARETQSLLASRYTQSVSLHALASNLGVSVFHLCRIFKRVTGTTIGSELQRLRVRDALIRLDEGERDLTSLGLALGYSHHSHFTASFRRELGLTPSAARSLLEAGSLSSTRRLLAN